jgi:hypothetical protein
MHRCLYFVYCILLTHFQIHTLNIHSHNNNNNNLNTNKKVYSLSTKWLNEHSHSIAVNKVLWILLIVALLTLLLLVILKISIDLANNSKLELLKYNEISSRQITEQIIQETNKAFQT